MLFRSLHQQYQRPSFQWTLDEQIVTFVPKRKDTHKPFVAIMHADMLTSIRIDFNALIELHKTLPALFPALTGINYQTSINPIALAALLLNRPTFVANEDDTEDELKLNRNDDHGLYRFDTLSSLELTVGTIALRTRRVKRRFYAIMELLEMRPYAELFDKQNGIKKEQAKSTTTKKKKKKNGENLTATN